VDERIVETVRFTRGKNVMWGLKIWKKERTKELENTDHACIWEKHQESNNNRLRWQKKQSNFIEKQKRIFKML
jgi:hypothetical protein